MLPKYRINDQVIILSKDTDITYSLGIVKSGRKDGGPWEYDVIVGKTLLAVIEDYILGRIYEGRDLTDERKKEEEAIKF